MSILSTDLCRISDLNEGRCCTSRRVIELARIRFLDQATISVHLIEIVASVDSKSSLHESTSNRYNSLSLSRSKGGTHVCSLHHGDTQFLVWKHVGVDLTLKSQLT